MHRRKVRDVTWRKWRMWHPRCLSPFSPCCLFTWNQPRPSPECRVAGQVALTKDQERCREKQVTVIHRLWDSDPANYQVTKKEEIESEMVFLERGIAGRSIEQILRSILILILILVRSNANTNIHAYSKKGGSGTAILDRHLLLGNSLLRRGLLGSRGLLGLSGGFGYMSA